MNHMPNVKAHTPLAGSRLRATGATPRRCGARSGERGELGEWATGTQGKGLGLSGSGARLHLRGQTLRHFSGYLLFLYRADPKRT